MKRLIFFLASSASLLFLLTFSSAEYFLLLRHKSAYMNDSQFYRHVYYTFQGNDFETAYAKVLINIDIQSQDEISKNFYLNKETYKSVLGFFTKRPLYPLIAYLLNLLLGNEFLAFLLPTYLSFIGCVLTVFLLARQGQTPLFATATSALFISFSPFLDWSTYFLTDTMGAFFWMVIVYIIFKIVAEKLTRGPIIFAILLGVSLFAREQSLLFVVVLFLFLLLIRKFEYPLSTRSRIKPLYIISCFFAGVYLLISSQLKVPTIIDTLVYTQNNYGLFDTSFTPREIIFYQLNAIFKTHIGLVRDLLSHHWWFVFSLLGITGIIYVLREKKPFLIDLVILCSGIASYAAVFIYPVLSYRYFFPVVFTLVYFAIKIIGVYFEKITQSIIGKDSLQ